MKNNNCKLKSIFLLIALTSVIYTDCYGKAQYPQSDELAYEEATLQSTKQNLHDEGEAIEQEYANLESRKEQFVKGLSDKEREVYEDIHSGVLSQDIDDPIVADMNRRRLDAVLTWKSKQFWEQIKEDAAKLDMIKAMYEGKKNKHKRNVALYSQKLSNYRKIYAANSQKLSSIRFKDVTEQTNITFMHTDGSSGEFYIM